MKFIIIQFISITVIISVGLRYIPKWPVVIPWYKKFILTSKNTNGTTLHIRSYKTGNILYNIHCIAGKTLVACGLKQRHHKQDLMMDTLLAFRGREVFGEKNLHGQCSQFPDYGNYRIFKLRGMQITVNIKQIQTFDSNNFKYHIKLSIYDDSTALSAMDNPVRIQRPKKLCQKIFHRHVPGNINMNYIVRHQLQPPFSIIKAFTQIIHFHSYPFQIYWHTLTFRIIPSKYRVATIPIYSIHHHIAYLFICSEYNDDPTHGGYIDRYGIGCGLYKMPEGYNVLGDAIDPYSLTSPAEIFPNQLSRRCKKYPFWGALREFKMRHIDLTLKFSNIKFAGKRFHALKYVNMKLSIRPDKNAWTPVALPPSYPNWMAYGWSTMNCTITQNMISKYMIIDKH